MIIKQSSEELVANLKAHEESLKPAVLLYAHASLKSKPEDIAKAEANAKLVNGYIQQHFTDANGVTDFSLENLRATVLALTDDLAWSVPPKNFGSRQRAAQRDALNAQGMGHHRTEFDRPELNKPQPSVYEIQREKEEKARVNIANAQTEKIISSHQGRTHARTNAERGLLRAERDRLVKAGTDPKAIKDAIEKKVATMKPSALGS